MSFGYQYDPAKGCSGKAQPGTRVLRDTMDLLVPDLGDYGIYNCRSTRTGKSYSLHAEGRAWDCAIPSGKWDLGDLTAQFFVDAAQDLGVQRVIWGRGPGKPPKEWDSREGQRFWSAYSGPPHDDHNHVELCWAAARSLTPTIVRAAFAKYWKGDELSAEDKALLEKLKKEVFTKGGRSRIDSLDQRVKALEKK